MRERRWINKEEYTNEIYEYIIKEINKSNSYLEVEKEKIDITNNEICKIVKTEFVALKNLCYDKYAFIKIENEVNHSLEFIELDAKLINLIRTISSEINESYQLIFLKQKEDNVIFDYDALKRIIDFIRWTIKFIKLLHKFKDKKKGLRPLEAYLNSLKSIIENSYNEALIKEAQREYDYYKFIESKEKEFKKDGFIFESIQ